MGTLAQRLANRDRRQFVGRRAELAFFDRLLVDEPDASVVLVHGPGGVGKSSLLREVARRAAEQGFTPFLVEGRDVAPAPGEIEAALDGVHDQARPLVLLDTYERISAAGTWLRQRLVPSLPERALVVLAGRGAPDPAWFQGGWEQLVVELELAPMQDDEALELLHAHGLDDDDLGRRLASWADGLPLALSLAADAVRRGDGSWRPERIEDHPNLVRDILRRVAQTELDGGNRDVVGVAAIARATDARLLRDVLPDVDPEEAEAWLRARTFTEEVAGGLALHDLVRRAVRADIRATRPERERELRRRVADHLHRRAVRGEPRLLVDLAQLLDDPALRWGLGDEGSDRFRPDLPRPEDAGDGRVLYREAQGRDEAWDRIATLIDEAPEVVVTVRDAQDALCGIAVCVTPDGAPPAAEADPVLATWLRHVRTVHAGEEVLVWSDVFDFRAQGSPDSPVLSILNTAAILRSGLANPRRSFLPIDPRNPAAVAFARAVGARHVEGCDVALPGGKVVRLHELDHGPDGMLGAFRLAVHAELGLAPSTGEREAPTPAPPAEPATLSAAAVRDALRNLERPLDLAASPLAMGRTPEERAASVRRALEDAATAAFGASADEELLRRVLVRGYLDPAPSHELAADELHLSRATYFRRLRTASQRVADYLLAARDGA